MKAGVDYIGVITPFFVKIDPNEIKIGNPEKMEEIGWFKMDNLPKLLHPGTRYVIKRNSEYFKIDG